MNYHAPFWLRNGHLQSIYPALFRKVDDSFFKRDRISTPDDDFLDLDWARQGNKRAVVITHGLEGNSRRPYVLGMTETALRNKWDVCAWNFRSCSGQMNKRLTTYHSGETHDLELVINTVSKLGYSEIALIGFSIGGNKTLLYLGREKTSHPTNLLGSVTFSVPLELSTSSAQLAKKANRIYMLNFLKSFREKFEEKNKDFPNAIDLSNFNKIKTFKEFDGRYTAPMNNFSSAEEYWRYSSSLYHLAHIDKPSLIVNALDDPFLSRDCFPDTTQTGNENVILEAPQFGGHVGFMPEKKDLTYWSERRAFDFLNKLSRL